MDPFDSVTPIGREASLSREEDVEDVTARTPQPAQFRALGQDEKRRRSARTHAERAGRGDVHTASKQPRTWSRRPLRVAELLAMCSQVARRFHAGATARDTKPHEAKHFGVGLAVMVDKLNTLEGRPTQILGVTDEVRPASHDLAGKLAVLRGGKATA